MLVGVSTGKEKVGTTEIDTPSKVVITLGNALVAMYVPREEIESGGTFNHELHHVVRFRNMLQTIKQRIAANVRAKLADRHKKVMADPKLASTLLSKAAIKALVEQEKANFQDFLKEEIGVMHSPSTRPTRPRLPRSRPTGTTSRHRRGPRARRGC